MPIVDPNAPQVTVTIYLLKQEVEQDSSALRERHKNLIPVPLAGVSSDDVVAATARLYVAPVIPRPPDWLNWLSPRLAALPDLETSSAAGVVFVNAGSRLFAVTFGHGHSMLEPAAFERRFGLLAALNSVDSSRLRGLAARALTPNRLMTDRQTVRLGDIDGLGVTRGQDVVRSLIGELADGDLGSTIAGRDSAKLTTRARVSDLEKICEQLLLLSESDSYKADFDWVDSVDEVTDPVLRDELDKAFVDAWVGSMQGLEVDLYPPTIPDSTVVKYRIGRKSKINGYFFDFVPALLARAKERAMGSTGVNDLKTGKLRAFDASGKEVEAWSLWQCLSAEIELAGVTYLLDSGGWFSVQRDFSTKLESDIAKLKSSPLDWPDALHDEREEDYNARAAEALGWACLDQQFGKLPGYSDFEFCDVLGDDWWFCHVKKRSTGSAGLGHLAMQASVAAEALHFEPLARTQLETLTLATPTESGFEFSASTYDSRQTTVVLGVITSKKSRVRGVSKFPFFAKLVLRQQVRSLEGRGAKVYVDVIDAELTP